MALSLQSASLVRQKVYNALAGTNDPTTKQRLWWAVAKEFFLQHAEQGNADLQFIPYSEADADDDDGTALADAACEVFLFYVKKIGSATTANTVKLFDHATLDTTSTDQTLSIPLDDDSQESMQIYPTGFSHAVGVTVTQHTTIEGATDGSDGGSGFIVIGAAR
jgi:hypothetical protein